INFTISAMPMRISTHSIALNPHRVGSTLENPLAISCSFLRFLSGFIGYFIMQYILRLIDAQKRIAYQLQHAKCISDFYSVEFHFEQAILIKPNGDMSFYPHLCFLLLRVHTEINRELERVPHAIEATIVQSLTTHFKVPLHP